LGPKERREREREEIRGLILDAARDLFVTEGYESVTMRRIAEKIEYSATAIYFHFKDKEALLKELCNHDFLSLAQGLLEIQKIPDPIEQLRQIGLAYIQFGITHPNHYRLMFMTPHPPVEPDDEGPQKGNPEEDAYAFLKEIVAGGMRAKRFLPQHDDVELVAQTMWAGVHGVISLQIAKCNDGWIDWRELETRSTTMIDLMIAGLLNAEPTDKPRAKR
jgi:AcrR family transcriptional regulator